MKNTWESPQKYLGGGSKNTQWPPPIHDHNNITGHTITIENLWIVGRQDQNLIRIIKEAPCFTTMYTL